MTSIRKYNDRLKLHNLNNPIHVIYGSGGAYFQKIAKVHKEKTQNSVYCKCGHSISFPATVDYLICNYCGCKVKNTTKNHFKYKLRKLKGSDSNE